MQKYRLVCIECGKEYKFDDVEYLCPICSVYKDRDYLSGVLKVLYDYEALKKSFTIDSLKKNKIRSQGRYLPLLPLKNLDSLPPLEIGPTPLECVSRLRGKYGFSNLYVKNDTCLPTGSFKDRASSVVVAKARELGKNTIATASTGNAATALAGMCASIGMKSVIYVPSSAPKAKLAQIAMFGAELQTVKGTYDDAFRLSIEAAKENNWYNRNTGLNPYTIEGKKTAGLEVWEQLGYEAPDKIFIPTGDGVILAGTYKAFYDLRELGLIKNIPQLIPVQSTGSAAIVDAFEKGLDKITPLQKSATIADSISVCSPACGRWVLEILKETNSFGVKVSDSEILKSMKELAELTGIFAEPAAAASLAGFKKAYESGKIRAHEKIILFVTGTGLKDVEAAMKAINS